MANFFDQFDEGPYAIPERGRDLLRAIAGSESPSYDTIYGGRKFSDFSDHPRVAVPITSGPNAGKTSSAAGLYQFLGSTWDEVANEAGLTDFSPRSQDAGAWHLAQKVYRTKTGRDLAQDLESKDPRAMQNIGNALSGTWTSLPGGIEPNRATGGFITRASAEGGRNFFDQFDAPTKAQAPVEAKPKNFFDQFDTPAAAPASAAKPQGNVFDKFDEKPSPGLLQFPLETGKAVARGLSGTLVESPLQGIAGHIYEPDTSKVKYWDRFGLIPNVWGEGGAGELSVLPVAQSTPYKAAQAVSGFMENYAGSQKILNPLFEDVAQGFGSLGGNIAQTMIPGLRALTLPNLLMQGAGEATERAVKAGATEEQIRLAARFGNVAGATELVDALLPNLGTYGKSLSFVKRVGARAIAGAMAEGGQEYVQQIIQNWIAKEGAGYKPEQELTEKAAYNMLVGMIVGGVAAPALGRKPEAPVTAPTRDVLESALPTGGVPPGAPPEVVSRLQLERATGGVVVGGAPPLGGAANANVNRPPADVLPFVQPAQTEPAPPIPTPVVPPTPTVASEVPEVTRTPASTVPAFQFTTAKGSVYTGFEDGTTIRNKAERAEHPGDVGVKEQSQRTIFLDPDAANRLGQGELQEWRFVEHPNGTMSLAWPNPATGAWGISPEQREVKFWKRPGVGLVPLELWNPETIHGLPAYRKAHFGNPITEVELPPFSKPSVPPPQAAIAPEGMVTSNVALRGGAAPAPATTAVPSAPQMPAAVESGGVAPPPQVAPQAAPPPPPPLPVGRPEATLPPDHVAFMEEQARLLESPPALQDTISGRAFDPELGTIDSSLSPLKEEVKTQPGADQERLADLLSQQLYGDMRNVTAVSVKEMFQNAFDAIKGFLERNPQEEGNIEINMNQSSRVISVKDDGLGMPASVMGNEFLKIAGTKKETQRASGGHGIAKMQFLFGATKLRVMSLRNGQFASLTTGGEELRAALKDPAMAPDMTIRQATAEDLKLFPKGHGTLVEVTVPDSYVDPKDGSTKFIEFSPYAFKYHVLQRSPLFDKINVKFNNDTLEMGNNFPIENFTQLANVNFDWGTARIYIEKVPNPNTPMNQTHILSNGLWQFSVQVKKGAKGWDSIPFTLFMDVNPRVTSTQLGYPFHLNRQEFSPAVKTDFANIFNYIGLLYARVDLEESAKNFGSMQYMSVEPSGKLAVSSPQLVEPKVPPPKTALTLIEPGDSVRVEDGRLIVNGRQVPELTPDMIENYNPTADDLRVDQSEIDPTRPMLHDNVNVEVSKVETLAITDYMRNRFGEEGDHFIYKVGEIFRELRDWVVKFAPPRNVRVYRDPNAIPNQVNEYQDMASTAVGVSFDIEYRGVSIKLPFHGMFVNPFVTQGKNAIDAASDLFLTMLHEIAHFNERSHEANWRDEFVRLIRVMMVHPQFNHIAFQQRIVDAIQEHQDLWYHMRGVFLDGNFIVRPRGKRFEDSGSNEATVGSSTADDARSRGESGRGSKLSHWVAAGETIPEGEPGRQVGAFEVAPSRAGGPSDGGRTRNYNALKSSDPGITAPPQQPENSVARAGLQRVLNETGGGPPSGGNGAGSPPSNTTQGAIKEFGAHADRMNWYYKFMTGITELLDANPYFEPLRKYVERVFAMHNDETKVHDAAIRIMKDWRGLGEQSKNLQDFILDIQNMPYLSPQERQRQGWRHPTQQEFNALVAKHGLSNEALKVYIKINEMNVGSQTDPTRQGFLGLIEQEAIEKAKRTFHSDPVKLADRIDEIRAHGRLARSMPFFPFTHFGRYFVVAKDSAGNVVHFETFEPKRFLGLNVKRAEKYQTARKRELEGKLQPGHTVETGVLPESAEPFIGMPTLLLQEILDPTNGVGLTDLQRNALVLMQSIRNPAMAFKDRGIYSAASKIPGYSLDLRRSFARYYFHGGRYFAKLRHAWALRGHVAEASLMGGFNNKSGQVASYMTDHLQNVVLDSRGDFGFFRGAIFLWAMGYVPAAATQNMTQTPMITLPFLAAKFGDVRAARALVRASTQMSSYYRRGNLEGTGKFELDALSYGVKTGRITETQAADLAGMSVGGTLFSGQGGSEFQRHVIGFQEKAAFMFEMMEQLNRRVAFRAALKLAQQKPNAKYVKDSIRKYKNEYDELTKEHGGDTAKAAAIVTAINVVDQTQYVYARVARPRFMRGPVGATLFVFKRYMQSTINMLGHNKADVFPRFLILAMLFGGLGGVPGYEDVKHIFRAFGRWWFGKDSDVDRMVRDYALMWFNGKVDPDLILHGLARRGYGIPALVDMMGAPFTGRPGRGLEAPRYDAATGKMVGGYQNIPFPVLDRSRALSMGVILPAEVGKIFDPGEKQDHVLSEQIQKASGAVFSVGFNMIKAATDAHMESTDPKRWERAVPRALGAASRGFRSFFEGRERGGGKPDSAPTITPYDVRDPEQMMEILAIGMGYQTLRNQAKWDSVLAHAEVKAFHDMERKGLMESFFEAKRGQNSEEIEKVRQKIIRWNEGLSPADKPAYAISGDQLVQSIQRRTQELVAKERGQPRGVKQVPSSREIDRLFPEATVDVRRVR